MAPKAGKGKKNKAQSDVPSASNVTARDIHQRLSYLHQASALLTAASARRKARRGPPKPTDAQLLPTQTAAMDGDEDAPVASSSKITVEDAQPIKEGKRAPPSSRDLIASNMTATMRNVALKAVVRVDYTMKRSICKGCGVHLLPGINCRVRTKPSKAHLHQLVTTCSLCGYRYVLAQMPTSHFGGVLRLNKRERPQNKFKRVPFSDRQDPYSGDALALPITYSHDGTVNIRDTMR